MAPLMLIHPPQRAPWVQERPRFTPSCVRGRASVRLIIIIFFFIFFSPLYRHRRPCCAGPMICRVLIDAPCISLSCRPNTIYPLPRSPVRGKRSAGKRHPVSPVSVGAVSGQPLFLSCVADHACAIARDGASFLCLLGTTPMDFP